MQSFDEKPLYAAEQQLMGAFELMPYSRTACYNLAHTQALAGKSPDAIRNARSLRKHLSRPAASRIRKAANKMRYIMIR